MSKAGLITRSRITGIPDAPSDGNTYGRKDNDWAVAVAGSGGVQTVTGDGVNNANPANPVVSYPTPAEIGALSELASQAEAEAGIDNTKAMTPLRVAQAIAILSSGLLNKYDATTPPGNTDDSAAGYSVGSYWIDIQADNSYRCVDATDFAAVWVKTTLQSSDLAAVAISGNYGDLAGAPELMTQGQAEAGTDTTYRLVTAQRLRQSALALVQPDDQTISTATATLDSSYRAPHGRIKYDTATGGALTIASGFLAPNERMVILILDTGLPSFVGGAGVVVKEREDRYNVGASDTVVIIECIEVDVYWISGQNLTA